MAATTVYERLAEIIDEAPDELPGMPAGKSVVFSNRCCWWSTDVRDALQCDVDGAPAAAIPTCPSCGSVLHRAQAEAFIAGAIEAEGTAAHPGMSHFLAGFRTVPCHRTWDQYEPWEPTEP